MCRGHCLVIGELCDRSTDISRWCGGHADVELCQFL